MWNSVYLNVTLAYLYVYISSQFYTKYVLDWIIMKPNKLLLPCWQLGKSAHCTFLHKSYNFLRNVTETVSHGIICSTDLTCFFMQLKLFTSANWLFFQAYCIYELCNTSVCNTCNTVSCNKIKNFSRTPVIRISHYQDHLLVQNNIQFCIFKFLNSTNYTIHNHRHTPS